MDPQQVEDSVGGGTTFQPPTSSNDLDVEGMFEQLMAAQAAVAAPPRPYESSLPDERQIAIFDPNGVEHWEWAETSLLHGWKWRMRPEPGADEFVFLAFASPGDGFRYRVFPIKPNCDLLQGHFPHMVGATVGGVRIPVICGPGGGAAESISEARAHAAKWMLYIYLALSRRGAPGFSG